MTVQKLLNHLKDVPLDWNVEIRERVHCQGADVDVELDVRRVLYKGGRKHAVVFSTQNEDAK